VWGGGGGQKAEVSNGCGVLDGGEREEEELLCQILVRYRF